MLQGGHEADVEHLTVFISKDTYKLYAVWFNAHRSKDGTLKHLGEFEVTPDGRCVAFCAINGHGLVSVHDCKHDDDDDGRRFYPHVGKYSRLYFMANDYCNKGYPWDGATVLLPDLEDSVLIEVRLVLLSTLWCIG